MQLYSHLFDCVVVSLRSPHVVVTAWFSGTAVDYCSQQKNRVPSAMCSDTPGQIFLLRPKTILFHVRHLPIIIFMYSR